MATPIYNEPVPWLVAVKSRLCKCFPYLSSAVYTLRLVPDEHLLDPGGNPTMGVDKFWRCYYHPSLEEKWSVDKGTVVLFHELWHLLREHNQRREEGSLQPLIWNIAGDIEINRGALPYGLEWPADATTYKTYGFPEEGLAEEYYDLLMQKIKDECPVHGKQGKDKQKQQGKGKQNQKQPGGQDGDQQDQNQQGQGQGQGQQDQQGQGQGQCTCSEGGGEPQNDPTRGGCGSGAHGEHMPHEQDDPGGDRNKGISPEESKRVAYEVAQNIKRQDKEKNHERGDIPGFLKRWADLVLAGPQVDWRKVFRAKVMRAVAYHAGRGESTYHRRSRRQQAADRAGAMTGNRIILPGQRKPTIRLGLQFDTSGSMSEDELSAIMNELRAIMGYGDTDSVYVIACDAAVHWEGHVTSINQVQLKGGGGTDMRVGIEHALAKNPPLSILIVATDTYTPWPQAPDPRMKVIVLSTNESGKIPDFYDKVYVDPKKLVRS